MRVHARWPSLGLLSFLSLIAVGSAGAQIAPSDTGSGIKLGVAQQNESAENGWVTLFPAGSKTRVVLTIFGERPGVMQFADIRRGNCDNVPSGYVPSAYAYKLNPVVDGRSYTWVSWPLQKLLSYNYSVIVHWDNWPTSHIVSCGWLYP